jgi:hypothetical protein
MPPVSGFHPNSGHVVERLTFVGMSRTRLHRATEIGTKQMGLRKLIIEQPLHHQFGQAVELLGRFFGDFLARSPTGYITASCRQKITSRVL